jgi:diguanylate cyclase (GGDEF)-like protein
VLHGAGSELLGISDPDELREVAQTAAERLLPGWRASLRRGPAPDRPRLGREGDEALIAVPVTDGTAPIGVIECRRPRRVSRPRESVRARELESLEALAAALGTALSRAELIEALSTQSSTDSLTGLANRRSFDAEIARSLAGLRRHGRPVSLCLVDVDHFKRFNDSHGHVEGDRALIEVARVLGQQVRGSDLAARYGGEEFALLLPDTELDVAFHVAERVRAAVARSSVPQGPVTVSIGLATAIEGCLPEQLIAAADGALYAAKAGGRNRVEAADAPLTGPD